MIGFMPPIVARHRDPSGIADLLNNVREVSYQQAGEYYVGRHRKPEYIETMPGHGHPVGFQPVTPSR